MSDEMRCTFNIFMASLDGMELSPLIEKPLNIINNIVLSKNNQISDWLCLGYYHQKIQLDFANDTKWINYMNCYDILLNNLEFKYQQIETNNQSKEKNFEILNKSLELEE